MQKTYFNMLSSDLRHEEPKMTGMWELVVLRHYHAVPVPELHFVSLDLQSEEDEATEDMNLGTADDCSTYSVQYLNCSLSVWISR